MRAVFVYIDTFYIFTVDISGNMISSVDNKTGFSLFRQFVCHYSAVQPGAYNQIIISFHEKFLAFISFIEIPPDLGNSLQYKSCHG